MYRSSLFSMLSATIFHGQTISGECQFLTEASLNEQGPKPFAIKKQHKQIAQVKKNTTHI